MPGGHVIARSVLTSLISPGGNEIASVLQISKPADPSVAFAGRIALDKSNFTSSCCSMFSSDVFKDGF